MSTASSSSSRARAVSSARHARGPGPAGGGPARRGELSARGGGAGPPPPPPHPDRRLGRSLGVLRPRGPAQTLLWVGPPRLAVTALEPQPAALQHQLANPP